LFRHEHHEKETVSSRCIGAYATFAFYLLVFEGVIVHPVSAAPTATMNCTLITFEGIIQPGEKFQTGREFSATLR